MQLEEITGCQPLHTASGETPRHGMGELWSFRRSGLGPISGKPSGISDEALKPSTENAMAMNGNERLAGQTVDSGRATLARLFGRHDVVNYFYTFNYSDFRPPVSFKQLGRQNS